MRRGASGLWDGFEPQVMTHFGFICPPYLGHINPMKALAAELLCRGHEVSFLGIPEVGDYLADTPFGFVPLGQASQPPLVLETLKARMAAPRGFGLFRIMRDMSRMTDMLCCEAPDAIRTFGIDALVVDQLEPAGGLLAEHLGLPHVSIANALPIDREPAIPPPFTDWRYDPTPWGLKRNSGGYRVADAMMGQIGAGIAKWCAVWDLPHRRRIDQCLSPIAQVSQMVDGFDFPRDRLGVMHPCGPFRRDEIDREPIDPGRPFVFASLGTLQGGRYDLFVRIARACQEQGVGLVIAHGGGMSAEQAGALPGTPIVRAFVAQRTLLAKAALAVTNGGLNTVLDALAAGVPVVTVPIAFEQGAIGARLEACGAGLSIPLRQASVARLGAAIARGLGDPLMRAAAAQLAGEVAKLGGAARGADVIERVARTRSSVADSNGRVGPA